MKSTACIAPVVLTCLGLVLSMVANAGSAFGTITSVTAEWTASGGAYFVYLNVPDSSAPTCATQINVFVLNPTTDIGKAQIATILASRAAGTLIGIVGSNTCNIAGNVEDILYVSS